jgi:hypothetical protein
MYAKILIVRGKVGDIQIAAAVSKLRKDDFQLNNLDVKTTEFGGIWLGEESKSVEENHWKTFQWSRFKKKHTNKGGFVEQTPSRRVTRYLSFPK